MLCFEYSMRRPGSPQHSYNGAMVDLSLSQCFPHPTHWRQLMPQSSLARSLSPCRRRPPNLHHIVACYHCILSLSVASVSYLALLSHLSLYTLGAWWNQQGHDGVIPQKLPLSFCFTQLKLWFSTPWEMPGLREDFGVWDHPSSTQMTDAWYKEGHSPFQSCRR